MPYDKSIHSFCQSLLDKHPPVPCKMMSVILVNMWLEYVEMVGNTVWLYRLLMIDQIVSLRAVLDKIGRADFNCQSTLTRNRCLNTCLDQ